MKNIIIGTAGHIDHGKSALIKALTGTDTDRLKEEKLRGISIDLGFAALELSKELTAGIIDVPGHERFLKNMLAGTGGIDLAILVIAADEGIMPQTREHLAMLRLYGIQHGLVVISKVDKVDGEWLKLVEEEVAALLTDSFLANAPLCRVSSITGEGVSALKAQMLAAASQIVPRNQEASFRLWIDRVFTVKGYGVVVTGTVLSGTARVGDSLMLYPMVEQVRVRGIEWHSHKVEAVFAGQRAAINLAGVNKEQITRGMSLSTQDCGEINKIWDVMLELQQPIENGTRVRLHVGTGEFLGRIYYFKNSNNHYMQLILEQALAAGAGDRGILRLYSPQILLGGVILIAPGKKRRIISEARVDLAQALKQKDVIHIACQVLADNGSVMSCSEIGRYCGYIDKDYLDKSLAVLAADKEIINLDNFYIHKVALEVLTQKCIALLEDFHTAQPELVGLSREVIKGNLRLADKIFDKMITYWQKESWLIMSSRELALPEHIAKYNDWCSEVVVSSEYIITEIGFTNIDVCLVGEKLHLLPEKAKIVFKILIDKGLLIQMENVCINNKTMQFVIQELAEYFKKNKTITLGQLRDILKTSRKVALSLLQYLNMNKYTVRTGDIYCPGLKMIDFPE